MKATILAVLMAIGLPLCCTPTKAQTPSKLTVSRSSVEFGDHDIGTITPTRADNTLTIRNSGDAAANFSLNLSGLNPKDFSTSSTCGGKVPAKGQCDITVLFSPGMTIVNGDVGPGLIVRSATLEVKGDSDTVQVQLRGSAFQNLGASPAVVELAIPWESSVAAPRLVSLTNYTDTQLESVAASVTGNFTEDHAGCAKVNPGNSCAVYVTYPPEAVGRRPRLAGIYSGFGRSTRSDQYARSGASLSQADEGSCAERNNLVLAIRCQHLVPLRPGRTLLP